MIEAEQIFEQFGAQLAEIAWYDLTVDTRIDEVVAGQRSAMLAILEKNFPRWSRR